MGKESINRLAMICIILAAFLVVAIIAPAYSSSADGAGNADWTQVAEGGFGDQGNTAVWSMATYKRTNVISSR